MTPHELAKQLDDHAFQCEQQNKSLKTDVMLRRLPVLYREAAAMIRKLEKKNAEGARLTVEIEGSSFCNLDGVPKEMRRTGVDPDVERKEGE